MKSYKYDKIVSFILFSNFLCHSNNSFIFQYMLNYMGELEVWILINIHVMNVYLTYMYYTFNILYTEIGLSCSLFKSLVNIYFIILRLFITLFNLKRQLQISINIISYMYVCICNARLYTCTTF